MPASERSRPTSRDRALDAESGAWLAARDGQGAERDAAVERLHDLLLRAARFELAGADDRLPGMRAHLEGCPACHEDHESLRDLGAGTPAERHGEDR